MRHTAVSLAIFLFAASTVAHAEPLYRIAGPSLLPKGLEVPIANAAEYLEIDLDLAVFEANPETLTLALPGGKRIVAVRERHVVYDDDYVAWIGTARARRGETGQARGETYVHLVYHGDRVTGILNLADGSAFQIVHDGYDGHQLVRIEAREGAGCGVEPAPPADPDALAAAELARIARRERVAAKGADVATKATYKLDLLAVYSDEFLSSASAEQSVRDFIATSVSIANDIFVQSGVNAQYNLVHSGPVTGQQPPQRTPDSALAWLNGNPPEVQTLRDSYGADVVAFFTPLDWSASFCGKANLRSATGCICNGLSSSTPFGDRAFSVNRNGCGLNDFTLAHEIGHNYGMLHDDDTTTAPLFSYAYGYLFAVSGTTYATVMGCNRIPGDITGAVCNRVRRFSEDNHFYQGVEIGDPTHRNRTVAHVQTPAYAGFRPTGTNGVPTVKITSPTRDTVVRRNVYVDFWATASDPEQGDLSAQIGWRIDGVVQGTTGQRLRTSFSQRKEYIVTAFVTDSAGKKAEWSVPILADNPPTANFTFSCSGLACSFTDTSTDDHFIRSWSWNFGNGKTSTSRSPSHTYTSTGTYTVKLTVTDSIYQTATVQKTVAVGCQPSSTRLCLQNNRFSVEVLRGSTLSPVQTYSQESGFFHFGNSSNLEVGVKILDGRPVNGRWWVYHGAMTSQAYTVNVTDVTTGTVRSYSKPASSGTLLCGGADTGAFTASSVFGPTLETFAAPLDVPEQPAEAASNVGAKTHTCFAGSGYICLRGRFKVEVKRSGANQPGVALTNESGVFWFFSSSTIEVPVKVLDGTGYNGKYWVFFGSLTDQSYQVVVTDTLTWAVKTYSSPGSYCGLSDTTAF